jgi:hypothetical protein
MIELQIRGHEELIDLFEKLPIEVRTKALKKAETKNAKVVKEFIQMRTNDHVKTGRLQRSIRSKVKVYQKSVHAKVTIHSDAYYGYILGHGWEDRSGKPQAPKYDLNPTPQIVETTQRNILEALNKAVDKAIRETKKYNKQFDKL